jgi:mycothiol synthase
MSTWKIQPVGEYERGAALTILFASDNAADTRAQVEQALARIAAGTADAQSLVWAVAQTPDHGTPAIGACWIEGQAGNVGYLHPPVTELGSPAREQCEQELFVAAEAAASAAGITWLQALLDPGAETTELLRQLGLWHASTLVYQAALLPLQVREPTSLRIRPLPYEASLRPQLEEVLAATYDGSLDCPALNGTRSAGETLQSYETIGQSGTRHWQLISRDETPIGCLLLAVHRPEDPATQSFGELIYWGVVPSVRGQGLGREILELALWQARELHLDKLVLAVDAANAPALRLYEQLGFFEWLRKEAWGKQVHG